MDPHSASTNTVCHNRATIMSSTESQSNENASAVETEHLLPTLGWKDGGPVIPWKFNNQRTLLTLFMRMNYGCWVRGFSWHRSEKVVKIYLEARGDNDLRHPRSTRFDLYPGNGTTAVFTTTKGTWRHEGAQPWGLYRGYLTLPERFFETAAGCSLVFRFAYLSPEFDDYLPLALAKFPEGTTNVLEDFFLGSGPTTGSHSSPVVRTQTPPADSSSPFPAYRSEQRDKWQGFFPPEVLERHFPTGGNAGGFQITRPYWLCPS